MTPIIVLFASRRRDRRMQKIIKEEEKEAYLHTPTSTY
jgi:hypothetical protein